MSNWIPVTERLPDKNCEVLMTLRDLGSVEYGRYAICPSYEIVNGEKQYSYKPVNDYDFKNPGFYIQYDETWGSIEGFDKVLAWMPMPEPYQKED